MYNTQNTAFEDPENYQFGDTYGPTYADHKNDQFPYPQANNTYATPNNDPFDGDTIWNETEEPEEPSSFLKTCTLYFYAFLGMMLLYFAFECMCYPEINVDLQPITLDGEGYRVWLFGDSILDNSYWNGVGRNSTGELLKTALPNATILERAGDALDAQYWLASMQNKTTVNVASTFVQARERLGIPYVPADGRLNPLPKFNQDNDFIFISIGANDFALHGETDTAVILARVKSILELYIQNVQAEHVYYVTPYQPNRIFKVFTWMRCLNLSTLYKEYQTGAKEICEELGCNIVSLESFNGWKTAISGIPEPTKKGAKHLASIIQSKIVNQVNKKPTSA